MLKSHNGLRSLEEEIEGIKSFLPRVSVDIDTGKIIWRSHKKSSLVGTEPGGPFMGYHRMKIDGKNYLRHRVVFYVAKGYLPSVVDHRYGSDKGDGIDNLREATQSNNCMNRKRRSAGTSKYKGVCFKRGKWIAQISVDGKVKHIGSYSEEVEAAKAYDAEAIKHFGDFKLLNFETIS